MTRAIVIALISLVVLSACPRNEADARVGIDGITRYPLADGIELVKVLVKRGSSPLGFIHAIYAEPDSIDLQLTLNPERKSIAEINPKALAVFNAGFFTEAWRATGFLRSRSQNLAPFISRGGPAGSGVFVLKNGGPMMLERDKTRADSLKDARFGIQAGPRIIENGGARGIRSDDGKHRNRTIIGADQRGRIVVACMIADDGWDDGLSLYELQELLGASGLGAAGHEDLKLKFALNLDGGPSTGFHLRHGRYKVDARESTPVHSIISVQVRP